MFWEHAAWAMGPPPGGQPEGPPQLSFFWVLLPLLAIFWVFLILPQRRQQRRHQKQIAALKRGDRVVTSGGIYGTVVKNEENSLILSIADLGGGLPGKKKGGGGDTSVNVRVAKSAIATILSTEESKPQESEQPEQSPES